MPISTETTYAATPTSTASPVLSMTRAMRPKTAYGASRMTPPTIAMHTP